MNGKLHHYTADTSDRTWVHVILFAVGTGCAWLFGNTLEYFQVQPPWWVEAPSLFGFYGLLFWLFNEYLWKIKFFRMVMRIRTPNLNGNYEGVLSSSHDRFASEKSVRYCIKQKWNGIVVFSETDHSTSQSVTGAFNLSDVHRNSFVFQYENKPKAHAPDGMNRHCGFADFYFETSASISGEFFNGRGRLTYGHLTLKRV